MYKGSLFFTSLLTFVICCLFDSSHLTGVSCISLGVWFAFPWWLVRSSIFSCASWPSVCLLWKNFCSVPVYFLIGFFFFLILSCMSSLCSLDINPLFCNRHETISTRPIAPMVSLAVVLMAESAVRGRSGPSPRGPPVPPASGLAGELGGPGTGWGLCPAGLQSSYQGLPLAGPRPWRSSEPLPHPFLCDLMPAAVCMGRSAWRSQQLEYTDTAIKVTSSTGFSLSFQVSKISPA